MKIADRIRRSVAKRKGVVFLRSEFAEMGSAAQVTRALSELMSDGVLIKVSRGAFAKTRVNRITGKPTPAGTLELISAELFKKLGVEVMPSRLEEEYNRGLTTQIPMQTTVNTGSRRISRKVVVGSRSLNYENNIGRATTAY